MKTITLSISFLILALLFSCGSSKEEKYDQKNTSTQESSSSFKEENDVSANQSEPNLSSKLSSETQEKSAISSIAAKQNLKDTTHQFIRTADLKIKVNKVIEATYIIENIVAKHDGFVTFTNLTSQVNEFIETPLNNDTVLETTKFMVLNNMVIRVPNYNLDTVLKCIAPLVQFLDFRTIKANDVSLSLLANRFAQIRNNNSRARLEDAVAQQGKKLTEINDVENNIIQRNEQADEARIANLELKDKIQYSTINLELYQHQEIKRSKEINDKNMNAFEPSLAVKILHSLQFGWSIFESFLLFLIKFWPIVLLGLMSYFIIKKFGK